MPAPPATLGGHDAHDRRPAGRPARRGRRPGAPLLLVHGFTGSKEDFDPVVDALAERRRVVALDLPGHGGSPGPDDPAAYGLAPTAGWILRAADAVGLGEFHLLGHSHGGLVVQRVASAASQRLGSLVLMATGMGALRDEAAEHCVRIAVAARDESMEKAYLVSRDRPGARDGIRADPVREAFVRRRFLALNPAAVVGFARNLMAAAPLGAFLRGVDIPVLVIHGEHDDAWLPAEQALLARTAAGAELAVVPDAVHSPQLENPSAWLAVVDDFLQRADARR